MAYIGNSPGVSSQRIVTTVTATAGQTTFTPSSGYTVGYLDVYLNGIKLINGTDYTASDGSTVVLTDAAALDDVVELMAYIPRGLSDGYTKSEADARYDATGAASTAQSAAQTYAAGLVDDLSGVTNASGARTNLGLGSLATKSTIGTTDITDGAVTAAKLAAGAAVPVQTGNSGKFLTTDGTNASWGAVDLASRVDKTGDTMTGTLNLPTVNATTDVQVNSTLLANSSRIRFPSGTSNPSSPSTGDGYLNTSTKELRIYTGTEWGYVVFAAPGTQQNPYASVAAAQSNGQATGLVWFKNSAGDAQQLYYDSADGGWILIASNDARSSTLPSGSSRNSLAYTVNRNGTSGALGTADPNSDYLIGGWINTFSFSRARGFAFGYNSSNGTYSFTNPGTYVNCQFNVTSFNTIVPRSSVTISGSGAVSSLAAYWSVDGIRSDYNADGSIGANSNQTTIGMVGTATSNGDPTNGCYYGHGNGESNNNEGWYDGSNAAYDCQGYTTWVR